MAGELVAPWTWEREVPREGLAGREVVVFDGDQRLGLIGFAPGYDHPAVPHGPRVCNREMVGGPSGEGGLGRAEAELARRYIYGGRSGPCLGTSRQAQDRKQGTAGLKHLPWHAILRTRYACAPEVA